MWIRGTVNDNFSQFKTPDVYEEAQGPVEIKNMSAMKRCRGENNRRDLSSQGNSEGRKRNKSRCRRQCTRTTSTNLPTVNQMKCSSHPFTTRSENETSELSFFQPNRGMDFSSNEWLSFVGTNKNKNPLKVEPKEVVEW